MQENIQVTLVVIVGTLILISLVGFIIYSVLVYQKAQGSHQIKYEELKNQYQKEILEVNLEVRESTLNKVSEEIHDNVGQVLSLVKLNLHQIEKKPEKEQIKNTLSLLNTAILGLRNVAHIISSNNIDKTLVHLLEKEIEHLNNSKNITAQFISDGSFHDDIDSEKTLILYRMVQEIINNAIKHADATTLKISLNHEIKTIILIISDNGKGFEVNKVLNNSNGLLNLQRRAQIINANFVIESIIGIGTSVKITFNNTPIYND